MVRWRIPCPRCNRQNESYYQVKVAQKIAGKWKSIHVGQICQYCHTVYRTKAESVIVDTKEIKKEAAEEI